MTEHVLPPRRARSNRLPDLARQTAWTDIKSWIPRLKFNWESFFALAAVSVGGVAVYSLYGKAIADPESNAAVWLGKDYLNVLPPVAPLVPRPDAGIVDPTPTKLSPPTATRIVTISALTESFPTTASKLATPTKPPTEAPTLVPATEVPAQFKPAEEYINDPNGQWVDFGPNVLRWQKQPKIPIAFGGTNYEFGSAAGVVFKDMITDKDGLQRALFGFKRGNDSFLFTVLVDPVTCVDDRGYPPTGFDLLKTENRVNIYLFFKGSPKPAIEIGKACAFVNDLKVAQINYISSYFVGQKHDQAGKILDLSDQLVLADVR